MQGMNEGGLLVLATLLMTYGMTSGINAMQENDNVGVLIGGVIVLVGVVIGWFIREKAKVLNKLPPIETSSNADTKEE